MKAASTRILSGCDALDQALGGGFPAGCTLVVEGPQGVGSTEFALTMLRHVGRSEKHHGTFASCLRSAASAQWEAAALVGTEDAARIRFAGMAPDKLKTHLATLLAELGAGDILVLESAAALARSQDRPDVVSFLQSTADAMRDAGAMLVVLHAVGTLPAMTEEALRELADGVFSFELHAAGNTRRRTLAITKLRGLAPALDGEQIPVFEASLRAGVGFSVSRVKSLM